MDGNLVLLVELDILDAAALDADQVVMVVLQGLGQLVSGHPVTTPMERHDRGVGEHGEGSVDRRERHRAVEVDLGGG